MADPGILDSDESIVAVPPPTAAKRASASWPPRWPNPMAISA